MFGTINADTIYYNLGDGTDSFDDYYSFLNRGGHPYFGPYVDIAYGGPVFGNGDDLKYYDYAGIETDSISDPGARVYRGQDKIVFGAGITPDMISLGLGSLFIRVGNDGQGIHVDGFDPADPYKPGPLGLLQFADGTTLSYSQLIDRGFDVYGTEFGDGLTGTAVADRIQGFAGDDFLDGGAGNDFLTGGEGNDTYNFGRGYGQDRIVEVSSITDQDTLQITAPWNFVNVSRAGDDIVIGMRSTSDRISMNWFGDPTARIEAVTFSDGTVWDAAILESRIDTFVNAAPTVLTPIEDQQATEGTSFMFVLSPGTFDDTDPGDTLTLAASQADGSPLPGWLSFDAVGATFHGTPDNADVGNLALRVTATDSAGASASSAFQMSIANVNDAPAVTNPVAGQSAIENQPFTLTLPADAFTDVDAGDSFVLAARNEDGSSLPHWLSFDPATRTFSGTPRNQDVGTRKLKLLAVDRQGAMGTDIFAIDVANVNDAPLLVQPIADQSATVGSPLSFSLAAVTFADIDADDTLTLSATRGDGSPLPAWLSYNPADRSFTGTPGNADGGRLDVRVTATDRAGAFASSQFNIVAIGGNVNHAPVAHDDTGAATEDGGPATLPGAALLVNDTDQDAGDTKHIVSVSNSAAGAHVSLATSGDVVYDIGRLFQNLGQGATAADAFTYTVADFAGATSSATVTMTIAGVNDAPATAADTASAFEDGMLSVSGNLLANDSDIDAGTILRVAAPGTYLGTYGSLALAADGAYSYTLNNSATAVQSLRGGQVVTDVFAYAASDDIAQTPNTLTVSITGTNDSPVLAKPIADQTAHEDTSFVLVAPPETFSDPDQGDLLSYSASRADGIAWPAWLKFDPATRTFSGTPSENDLGAVSVRLTAADADGLTAQDVFQLNVPRAADLHLVGTNRDDVLVGKSGNDLIEGRGGNDRLLGHAGNDILIGGTGVDFLDGGADSDLLEGNQGADSLIGGGGTNLFVGGRGNDLISTSGTNDIVLYNEGDGRDRIDVAPSNPSNRLTLSFGGGIRAEDLELKRSGQDLKVALDDGDSLTLRNWYDLTAATRPQLAVQTIGRDVRRYDLSAAVNKLAKSGAEAGDDWRRSAIADRDANGNPQIIGGALAFVYAKQGSLDSLSRAQQQAWLASAGFGSPQSVQVKSSGESRHSSQTGTGSAEAPLTPPAGDPPHLEPDRVGRDTDDSHRTSDPGPKPDTAAAIEARLARSPLYDFETLMRTLAESPGRGDTNIMISADIAKQWAALQRYASGLVNLEEAEHRQGALLPTKPMEIFGGAGFGFEASIGAAHGRDRDLKTMQGLSEGFKRL
jgi:VCBS repeat-containing protein